MTKTIVLLLGLALLGSFSKEHANLEQPQTEVAMGTPASLELAGDVNLSFGYGGETPIDELGTDESDNARALDVYQREDQSFSFEIDIDQYKDEKMQLFLRRTGSESVTSVLAPVTITKLENGKYHMRVVMENVRPIDAADFTSGEWFITGFWGGGPQEAKPNSTRHSVKDVSPNSPDNLGDKVRKDIPLGFPWTRIVAEKKGATMLLKHEQLKIQPMGILFSLMPNNRTVYKIELAKLDKELQGFAIGGYFDAAAEAPVEGKFPSFNKGFDENLSSDGPPVLPYDIPIASGKKAGKPVYLWAIPTEDQATDYLMSFTFMSKERASNDLNIPAADRFNTNGTATFTDRYTVDYTFKKKPEHSQYFIKEMKIRTSPMITEYFINRVRNNQVREYVNTSTDYWGRSVREVIEEIAVNDPYFYGYVEIYNPNLDGINLEHYALCRIANIRTIDARDSDGNITKYGPNYPYFHPMAEEKFPERERAYMIPSSGLADRRATVATESHKALLLSLKLKNGEKSSFGNNSLGFKSQFETVSRKIEEAQEQDADNNERIEKVRFFKGEPARGGKAILKGGKTMILLGNGYLERTGSYVYREPGTYRNLERKHADNDLDYIADLRVKPLPEALVTRLWYDDECQIIVAVDNYKDKSTNPNNIDYLSIYRGAGVMNLGWHDALFIVQKHKNNPSRRRIVDATSANPFARVNNWTQFVAKVTLASETDAGWPHFRVRTVAQHLPEFLNFSEKQWHPALYTGTIPAKVSPGRRSAVGL